jgi:hypothetical protein
VTTLSQLIAATRSAYGCLILHGADTEAVYESLTKTYAEHGLDANVAESSVDWFEGGTLADDLADALNRIKETS